MKLKKCQFGGNTVHYLGHMWCEEAKFTLTSRNSSSKQVPETIDEEGCPSIFELSGILLVIYSKVSTISTALTDVTKEGQM